MPNWCSNSVTLRHEDPAQIARAVEAFKRGEFLAELVPNPAGAWDYDWSVSNWGTKWDVGGDGYDPVVADDGLSAEFNFDSAWSPPITAYERMTELGFNINAMYYESGMAFAGMWDSEFGEDHYDLSGMDSGDVAQQLPQELDECFEISATMAEYEDEEPLTEWYKDGVEQCELDPHDETPHEFATPGQFVVEEGVKRD
jgi:hypothetical protein